MGKFKFAPCAFGLAAAVVFSANPVGVHAAPVTTTKMEVSYGDLDIQGKIIYTATEEVASPFYKKGISTAEDCVMIRKEPNAESEAVGKLYSGPVPAKAMYRHSMWLQAKMQKRLQGIRIPQAATLKLLRQALKSKRRHPMMRKLLRP